METVPVAEALVVLVVPLILVPMIVDSPCALPGRYVRYVTAGQRHSPSVRCYRRSDRTLCELWFACDSMACAACVRMLFFV